MQRYPLSWPEGWKRTAASDRKRAQFKGSRTTSQHGFSVLPPVSIAVGVARVFAELEKLGKYGDDVLISSNVPSRIDGTPRSDQREPTDPGVAVYWTEGQGKPHKCMAIDRYDRVADNLAAIAATLEAFRAIERHGGGQILNRAFAGFLALPARAGGKSWRDVLNFHPTETPSHEQVKARFRDMAPKRHPDTGGSSDDFRELCWARDAALQELRQ